MSTTFNEVETSSAAQNPAERAQQNGQNAIALPVLSKATALAAIITCAAVAGFFYAYACSVMYGLNDSTAIVALEAMQGINRTVRNPVFALSFFGTALLLPLAAGLALSAGAKRAGLLLATAALCYIGGGFLLTMAVNVPMNEALASVDVRALADPAKAWAQYEGPWSFWNWVRTGFSFAALLLSTIAFGLMSRHSR